MPPAVSVAPTAATAAAVNTAQLGTMITSVLANHDALREENAELRHELDDALRRVKSAESIVAASRVPGSNALAELQARLDAEQAAHAETRAHLRAAQDAWVELDRYTALLDVRAADARNAFGVILRDPAAATQRLPPLRAPSPFVPPRRGAPSHSVQTFPTLPTLPPAPSALPTRRLRAESIESRPAKRARPDPVHQVPEPAHPPPYYGTPDRYLHPSYAVYPTRQPPRGRSSTRRSSPILPATATAAAATTAAAANVTSPSRSRSRSRSLSVDHMLLDAAGESPPQVQTYQTHVFAPPVTGPPRKRALEKSGTVIEPYNAASHARIASTAAAAGLPAGGFPATNDKGQRICRQCGLPGRYKDGKCVEKWGPGPEGPGTVCDRCRKKMKRVERRGTFDAHALLAHHAAPPPSPPTLGVAHTLPARTTLAHPPIAALRSPPSPSRSPSLSPSHGSNGYPPRARSPTGAYAGKHSPRSYNNGAAPVSGRSPYNSYAPAPTSAINGKRTPPSDRDAEGETESGRDGEVEDDADVDDDLLEAVDAAEESRSNGNGHGPGLNGVKREVVDALA